MRGVAVETEHSAGGAQLAGGQNLARINGRRIVVVGDPVTSHGLAPHNNPTMVEGSALMRILGIPVCLEGHVASCGHATTGSHVAKVNR